MLSGLDQMDSDKEKTVRILVVDDTPAQLDLAKLLLRDHEVTFVSSWAEAKRLLMSDKGEYSNPHTFDVVLTDLMMPGEVVGLAKSDQVGKPVPYGFNVAMLALRCGVKKVAVVSNGQGDDGNHHQHPILWACDVLNGFNFEGRLMFFTGYSCPHMDESRTEVGGVKSPYYLKDWNAVLARLTA